MQLSWLLTHSATASEDIAQEAFVSLHRRYDQLINPAAYLTKTITNLCRSWHRNLFRRASLLHRLAQRVDDASADEDYLIDAIARLPYRQRVVIIGRFWAGLSEADLADTLSVRPGTVKSLASRALARLRQEVPQ